MNRNNLVSCALMKSARAKIIASVDLISDALPFGRLGYAGPNAVANAIGYEIIRNLVQKLHLLTASPNSLSLSPSHPGQFRR